MPKAASLICGCSSVVKHRLPKPELRVRFPSSAPLKNAPHGLQIIKKHLIPCRAFLVPSKVFILCYVIFTLSIPDLCDVAGRCPAISRRRLFSPPPLLFTCDSLNCKIFSVFNIYRLLAHHPLNHNLSAALSYPVYHRDIPAEVD